jgi:hypothetical protein
MPRKKKEEIKLQPVFSPEQTYKSGDLDESRKFFYSAIFGTWVNIEESLKGHENDTEVPWKDDSEIPF